MGGLRIESFNHFGKISSNPTERGAVHYDFTLLHQTGCNRLKQQPLDCMSYEYPISVP